MSVLEKLKSAIRSPVAAVRRRAKKLRSVVEWRLQGSPLLPPDDAKPSTVIAFAAERGLRTLVETGTYTGGTIERTKAHFDEVFSIELDRRLAAAAARRFRGDRHVHVLQGDSGAVLPEILRRIDRPALFWLDAHYSSGITAWGADDTPVVRELTAIMSHPVAGHAILVDDARLFGTDPAYPSLADVERLAARLWPGSRVRSEDDIIRIDRA